jgi:hypothetical protein
MQTDTAEQIENCSIALGGSGSDELPTGLPPNVVRVIGLLDKLDVQAAEIQRCVQSVCETASTLLAQW